jgi:hypothetical protein
MAQNRLSAAILGRKTGGSILARSAYNHRDQYRDDRTGKLTDDYRTRRGDLEWNGLFANDINNVPQWWSESRERIFNELEKREDRSTRPHDAQLAYDFKISLPYELTAEDRSALISEWALKQTRRGFVVDVAIHRPNPKENDPRNFHAHILMPMRPIEHNGWGNKFRAPENTRQGFNKWAEEKMQEWREQLSELGAQYLDHAGFHKEAERFREGHLSRPKRAKAAHDRGDTEQFEHLLDEPQRYMGPAASAMERKGKRTRSGDINREVEERNKLRGTTRDIRFAYALADGDHQKFIDALAEKDMMLARISRRDDKEQVIRFAGEYRDYVPQYREHEHVVVTEKGEVHRLTPTTTGDNWKDIREFSKQMYGHQMLSLAATLEEQKRRSVIPKVDRESVIAAMPAAELPTLAEAAMSAWIAQSLPHNNAAINVLDRRTTRERLRDAYNSSKTPEAFHAALQNENFHLVRVTAEDATQSRTEHWMANRYGRSCPILQKGEYVVVTETGSALRLDDKTVGHNLRETNAFMSKIDGKPLPSLREALNAVQEKRQKDIELREKNGRNDGASHRGASLGRGVTRGAEKIATAPVLALADAFESLFAPKLSPEEKRLAEVMEHDRQLAAERAERHRDQGGRDR